MKKFCLFIFCLFIVSCNAVRKTETAAVFPEPIIPEKTLSYEFGPIFLPENHALNSISLNYFTLNPEETSVYFTMAGDMDWVRKDQKPVTAHSMIFNGLEESALYEFSIHRSQKGIHDGVIQTVPYGEDYQFTFEVASIETNLEEKIRPHFLILLSPEEAVDEKEFFDFYRSNSRVLSSTILLPLFDWKSNQKNFSLSDNGFYFVRYKKATILMVYKDQANADDLSKYISLNPEDENYLILGNIDKGGKQKILDLYGNQFKRVFVYGSPIPSYQNVVSVNKGMIVKVVNKPRFAYNRP